MDFLCNQKNMRETAVKNTDVQIQKHETPFGI